MAVQTLKNLYSNTNTVCMHKFTCSLIVLAVMNRPMVHGLLANSTAWSASVSCSPISF